MKQSLVILYVRIVQSGCTLDWPQIKRNGERIFMSDAPVELERLTDNFGDDHEFLHEIYSTFIEDCALRVSALEEAVSKEDVGECSSISHAIKGASSNIGAIHVEAIAGDIEKSAHESDLSEAPARVKALREEFDIAVGFLKEFMSTLNV